MITVLFLESRMEIGGAEQIWFELLTRLDRRRFRPILCCLYDLGALGEKVAQAGVTVHSCNAAGRWDFRVGYYLISLLRRERPDVIYMMDQPLTQFWGTLCGKMAGIRSLVTSIHSTGKINRARRRFLMNRILLPFVDCVTALSASHKNYLVEKEWIHSQKIEVVPNGIEVERFSSVSEVRSLRESLGIARGESVVGIVAMLRPEKAHDVFLRAAARVLQEHPGTHFLMVGDGPERRRLEAVANYFGLEGRAAILGVRSDIPELLTLFDVAVLSSNPVVETLSVSVLESMAAGKPVVATRVGSLPDLIDDGENGFLVEPGDSGAMAERIIRLLKNPELAVKMGKKGREKVRSLFTVRHMVGSMEKLFEKMAQR